MKIKMKTVIVWLLVLAGAGIIAAPAIMNNLRANGAAGSGAGPNPQATAPTVYSVLASVLKTGSLQAYLDLTGDVVTETNVDIFPDVGGKLAVVYVKVGDYVVKGTTEIAKVDPSRPGASYSLSSVYSPLTGTITSVKAQLGATVSTATSLGTVGIMNDLYIESKVPEQDIASLRPGLQASINFEAYPGVTFSAAVERVSPIVDSASRTKQVRLRFLRQDSRVSPGMFARIHLFKEARPARVLMPQDAVVTRSGNSFAFVIEGDKAVQRSIVVGLTVDGVSEVLEGLSAGEVLVVKGQELLDDGVQVRVVNPTATASGGSVAR